MGIQHRCKKLRSFDLWSFQSDSSTPSSVLESLLLFSFIFFTMISLLSLAPQEPKPDFAMVSNTKKIKKQSCKKIQNKISPRKKKFLFSDFFLHQAQGISFPTQPTRASGTYLDFDSNFDWSILSKLKSLYSTETRDLQIFPAAAVLCFYILPLYQSETFRQQFQIKCSRNLGRLCGGWINFPLPLSKEMPANHFLKLLAK